MCVRGGGGGGGGGGGLGVSQLHVYYYIITWSFLLSTAGTHKSQINSYCVASERRGTCILKGRFPPHPPPKKLVPTLLHNTAVNINFVPNVEV